MITGDLKNKVDRLWTTFSNNGISNPLTVIEQISFLLFEADHQHVRRSSSKKRERERSTRREQ
jgi:type I restriction enzyme M protein